MIDWFVVCVGCVEVDWFEVEVCVEVFECDWIGMV